MGVHVGPPEPKVGQKREVDYLVIGSGFGGSVVAATLAEAGRQVYLFERGKAYPPGSFPRRLPDIAKNVWNPPAGRHGMYHFWNFQDIDAIVASGLGGGSLIYANVMLEKSPAWFTQKVPCPQKEDPCEDHRETWSFSHQDLKDHYAEVRGVLKVQEIPTALAHEYSPKTARFLDATGGERAPLAIRFLDAEGHPCVGAPLPIEDYGNIHGDDVQRTTCKMVGECDVGCNYGAKSSMDHTFLSIAHNAKATVCVRTDVRKIHRCDDESPFLFNVGYVIHREEAEGEATTEEPPLQWIRAKRVVLAAGTINSTYLMLSNGKELGIPCNDRKAIGGRFCGNGDVLGFAIPNDATRDLHPSKGPVITALRRFPAKDSSQSGEVRMYLQDGGFPDIASWPHESGDVNSAVKELWKLAWRSFWRRLRGRRRALILGPHYGFIADEQDGSSPEQPSYIERWTGRVLRSLPLLGMGADVPDGCLTLNGDDRLECNWNQDSSHFHFAAVRKQMGQLAYVLDSTLFTNSNAKRSRSRLVTVHPLGGCPADTSDGKGVVDSYGRVHSVPGMWITDGSVMPGPIGANPSLTIAAFARRAAKELLEEDLDELKEDLGEPSAPVQFTPEVSGCSPR